MLTWWAGRWAHAIRGAHGAAVPALAVQARGSAGDHTDARRSQGRRGVPPAAARTAPVKAASRAKTTAAGAAAVAALHITVVQARWHV